MRVCLPTTDDAGRAARLSDHFGRAPYYTIVDTETEEVEVVPNQSRHRGGAEMPPTYVAEYDVDAVLLDHVGKRGMELFDEYRIDVFQTGAGTVDDIVDRFQNGDLTELGMEDAHSHGDGHGHDHDHSHGDGHDHEYSHDQ